MAGRIFATVGRRKIPAQLVAASCNVSVQAVSKWRRSGNIDKKHLTTLASLTGLPLSWWLLGPDSSDGRGASGEPGAWIFSPWVEYSRVASLSPESLAALGRWLQHSVAKLERGRSGLAHAKLD